MYMYSIGWTKPHFIPGSKVKWHWILLSILLAICSLLSKEQGITALGVCISLDILLHWRPVILRYIRMRKSDLLCLLDHHVLIVIVFTCEVFRIFN